MATRLKFRGLIYTAAKTPPKLQLTEDFTRLGLIKIDDQVYTKEEIKANPKLWNKISTHGFEELGLIRLDNKLVTFAEFQKMDNTTHAGDLKLQGEHVRKLPRNLRVKGVLDISGKKILLSPGLRVEGTLRLYTKYNWRREINSIEIPNDVQVGEMDYDAGRSPLVKIGRDFKCGGDLDLSSSPLTELPPRMEVGGTLNLHKSKILELPGDLIIGGDLVLWGLKMKELPETLRVGGQILVDKDQKIRIPEKLLAQAVRI